MLPSNITIQDTPDGGTCFHFPRRESGPLTTTGRMLMTAGGWVAAMPILFSLFALVASIITPFGKGAPSPIMFFLVPLIFFGIICFPLGGYLYLTGAYRALGHCQIT